MTDLDSTEGVKQFALCKFDKPADGLRIWNRTLSESITTRLVQVSSSEHHLQLRCPSSGGDTEYAVYIELQRLQGEDIDWAVVTCTCPHANSVPLCKHGIAALLWRVPPEQNPGPQERHQPRNLSRLDNNSRYEGSQVTVPRSRLLPKSLRPQGTKGFDEVKLKRARGNNFLPKREKCVVKSLKPKRWMSAQEMEAGSDLELLQQCEECLGQAEKQDISEPKSIGDHLVRGPMQAPIMSLETARPPRVGLQELGVVADVSAGNSSGPVCTGQGPTTFSLIALFNKLHNK